MSIAALSGGNRGAASRGFTLIELLVVFLVLGLIVTLAPIGFQRVLPSLQVKSAARDVAAALREVRGQAIRENRERFLAVDVEGGSFGFGGERRQTLDADIELSILTAVSELDETGGGRIRFFADGTSTGGRVTLARGDTRYHVLIDWLTGRVRIVDRVQDDEAGS